MKSAAGDESGGQRSDPGAGEHAAAGKGNLPEVEWIFDNVPDGELVACCYWEYARESAFIRETLRQYRDWWLAGGDRDSQSRKIDANLRKIQSLGHTSDVFVQGCSFDPARVRQSDDPKKPNYRHPDAPPITGSFPVPWQSLSKEERKYRAHIRNDRDELQIVPFDRGHSLDAKDIAQWVAAQGWDTDAANERVRRENPKTSERFLARRGKLSIAEIQPSLFWAGGKEVTVVAIEWAYFTNDEIVSYFRRWAKANRPKNITSPSGQGHKLKDWRVALDRLGMMRLLHRFRLGEMRERFPAGWKAFAGFEWYKERKRAGATFKTLFPFLPKTERPLSWPTKGGRSKC